MVTEPIDAINRHISIVLSTFLKGGDEIVEAREVPESQVQQRASTLRLGHDQQGQALSDMRGNWLRGEALRQRGAVINLCIDAQLTRRPRSAYQNPSMPSLNTHCLHLSFFSYHLFNAHLTPYTD